MTGVQIGRVGGDLAVQSLASESWDSDRVTLALILRAATLTDLLALREQVLGLAENPDEPVVPVIVDGDDRLTGFYRVGSVSVEDPAGAHAFLQLSASVQLDRVPGASAPLIEGRTVFANRAASTWLAWTAVSGRASGFTPGVSGTTTAARSTASGDVLFVSGNNLAAARPSWWTAARDWYDGSAMLSMGATDAPPPGSTTFSATGAPQSYTVPTGVTQLAYSVRGGGSRDAQTGASGGSGAVVAGILSVTPGTTIGVYVGGRGLTTGAGGWNGGGAGGTSTWGPFAGGGGASDLRIGGSTLADRVVVAGGAGGGVLAGTSGDGGVNGAPGSPAGGGGGTQTAGGAGAVSADPAASNGADGALGVGGAGSSSATTVHGGPGGGGGYYGGGGGAWTGLDYSGGGGGSSLVPAGAVVTTGTTPMIDGSVTLTPVSTAPFPVARSRVVVGRQSENWPIGWTLTNGIIRAQHVWSGTGAILYTEAWNGAKWCTPHRYQIVDYTTGSRTDVDAHPRAITVLRNSPEAVSIRLTYDTATPGTTHTLDLTLRRGAAHVEGRWASTATAKYGIGHTPADAATAVGPYAVKATAADADGNTWLAIAPEIATLDTTGAVRLTNTGTQLRFGVGYSIGTPATGIDSPGSVVEQYLAGGSETVRVVGR